MTSEPVIRVEGLSKYYRLGVIGHGTLKGDLQRWWARMRGLPDPHLRIGQDHAINSDGELWALRDLNFTVQQGEIVGIIGRNGAGKSSLLKVLSRITAPTTGRALVRGRLASLLEVGTGFHPELTGRENVYLNGAVLGMRREEIRRKFDEIIDFAGVERFIDTPVKRYSSGMYVRLAFAVAAHLEPDVLVVDEVLAVGDAGFQAKCLGKMSDVARGGRTVLFVSHNMAAVAKLCARAIWLQDGGLRKDGKSDAVVAEYLDASTEATGDGQHTHPGFLYRASGSLASGDAVRVESVELLDTRGVVRAAIATSESAILRIGFSANRAYRSFAVEIVIATTEGVSVIVTSNSPDHCLLFAISPGHWSIDCSIDRFPLTGGEYLLGVRLALPGIEYVWRNDALCRLHVASVDNYGSGFVQANTRSLVVFPHRWLPPTPIELPQRCDRPE